MKAIIYSLNCPNTNKPKYIGQTTNLEKRIKQHFLIKYNNKNSKWIFSLKKNGIVPMYEVIDEVNENEKYFWEQFYISLYRSWGFELKNGTFGGEGGQGYKHTEKAKIKMSQQRKGLQKSLGRKHTEETKRKIGLKSAQKIFSQKTREKHRKNALGEKNNFYGKKHSEETRIRMREKWKERRKNYPVYLKESQHIFQPL